VLLVGTIVALAEVAVAQVDLPSLALAEVEEGFPCLALVGEVAVAVENQVHQPEDFQALIPYCPCWTGV